MFYFKFHIGDYRTDTQHLTLLEHGVYMTLMATYYTSEQPLPKDERQLLRLAGARTDEEKQAVLDVVNEFFIPTETHWVHSRIDFELSEYHSKAEANRENGKKGGRPKKNPPQKPTNNPSGFDSLANKTQVVSEIKPNDNPSETLTNKPINPLTHEPIIDIPSDKPKKKTAMKTLPDDFGISDQVRKWASENNHHNLEVHLDRFIEYAKSNGKKYADWDSAFKRAIREDWGKVNKPVYQNTYQSSQQRTAQEHDKWRMAEQQSFGEKDVTPANQNLIGEYRNV